jgi:ChrR Cupin-like domain
MELNADFTKRAAVHGAGMLWLQSPIAGVERRMLDRVGDEVARATTIVRYAAGSRFSAHTHGGGEEFLVLEGVFTDEHGDYPTGSYVRNPPTSSHRPGSALGCTILVKLWQFDPGDRNQIHLRTQQLPFDPAPERPGVGIKRLFQDASETVRLESWAPGTKIRLPPAGGLELFVLRGQFTECTENFETWSWLRLPTDMALQTQAGPAGCILWIKTGHLRALAPPAVP